MGILHADRLIEHFRRGLYNNKPTSYIVSVDGELIRYKGMVSANMTQHNAEEAVANTSYEYLVRTVMWIETYLGRRAREIIVFMDGARVANKTTARPECALDVSVIRGTFSRLCADHGYRVHALDHGESELQMYLRRDRDVDLNVLLTRDSDMLSICYDHAPKYFCTKTGAELRYADVERRGLVTNGLDWTNGNDRGEEEEKTADDDDDDDDTTFGVCRQNTASVNIMSSDDRITDINSIYVAENGVKVLDSCVWIVCGSSSKPIQVIGFDACAQRIGYNDTVFRTFAAMCGTDFTESMLTPSMFTGFFSAAGADEKRYINALKDVSKVVASILYMGIKGGGEIKRGPSTTVNGRQQRFNRYDITVALSMYYEYISTGSMANKRLPKFNTVLAVKHFVYAMRAGVNGRFVKRELIKWANDVPLYECLQNLDAHLGTYDPDKHTAAAALSSSSRKRNGVAALSASNSKAKKPLLHDDDDTAAAAIDVATDPFIHFLADASEVLKHGAITITPSSRPRQNSAAVVAVSDEDAAEPRRPPTAVSTSPLTPPELVFELDEY